MLSFNLLWRPLLFSIKQKLSEIDEFLSPGMPEGGDPNQKGPSEN